MSDELQKQATTEAAWATFSTNTCLDCWLARIQILFDDEKCVLLLCADFLRSSHIIYELFR